MHRKLDSVQHLPPMSELDLPLPSIRAELEQQRRFRLEQLADLTADAKGVVADAGDDARRQVTEILKLAAHAALDDIEDALQRLQNGGYGTCERCAEPIPVERLEVLPMTRLCAPCQYRTESGSHLLRRV